MEMPLTPIDFLRRARKLYADREAVVDGQRRLTYAQFGDRIDRWSAALQDARRGAGDRVAYIAPNTSANLEGYYAVPQIGAVIVPCNYRLTADDFAYLIEHSGSKVVCAHPDQMAAVDQIRDRLPASIKFVALEGARDGWLDYESLLAGRDGPSVVPRSRRARPALHQLHERDDVAAEGRDDHAPQRVSERGRHADPSADAGRRSVLVDAADVSRQRLDVHLDCDGGRRHARVPAQSRAVAGVPVDSRRADRACSARRRRC